MQTMTVAPKRSRWLLTLVFALLLPCSARAADWKLETLNGSVEFYSRVELRDGAWNADYKLVNTGVGKVFVETKLDIRHEGATGLGEQRKSQSLSHHLDKAGSSSDTRTGSVRMMEKPIGVSFREIKVQKSAI